MHTPQIHYRSNGSAPSSPFELLHCRASNPEFVLFVDSIVFKIISEDLVVPPRRWNFRHDNLLSPRRRLWFYKIYFFFFEDFFHYWSMCFLVNIFDFGLDVMSPVFLCNSAHQVLHIKYTSQVLCTFWSCICPSRWFLEPVPLVALSCRRSQWLWWLRWLSVSWTRDEW